MNLYFDNVENVNKFIKDNRLWANQNFEVFKSDYCHMLAKKEPIEVVKYILDNDQINYLVNQKKYKESLYLLALCKYIIKKYDLKISLTKYNELNNKRIKCMIFPIDTLLSASILNDINIIKDAYDKAIPEFKRFNIIEVELYDSV